MNFLGPSFMKLTFLKHSGQLFWRIYYFWIELMSLPHNSSDSSSIFMVQILHRWCCLYHNQEAQSGSDCPTLDDDKFVDVVSIRFLLCSFLYSLEFPQESVGWYLETEDLDLQQTFPIGFSISRWSLSESTIALVVAEWCFPPFYHSYSMYYLTFFVKKTSSPYMFVYHHGLMDF